MGQFLQRLDEFDVSTKYALSGNSSIPMLQHLRELSIHLDTAIYKPQYSQTYLQQ